MSIEQFDSEARDAAAESLASAFQGATPEGIESEPVSPVVTQDEPTQDAPVTDQQIASKEIDLSTLPPEAQEWARARERELTAVMTRATQEAAQQRQEAEQALQFIEALNSDPNFARQVYDTLATALEPEAPVYDDMALYDDGSDDPYVAKLAELEQWKTGLEQQFEEARWAAHVDRQISEIRASNPTWDDSDVNDIIGLGFATQGDLHKAAEMYKQINDRVVSKYVDAKSSVTAPAVLPNAGGFAPPESLVGADEKTLRAAAMERINAAFN